MEHRFTGPSYTLGIEEELMILDAETLDLVNTIETLLEEARATTGEVKPELMESVLEIAHHALQGHHGGRAPAARAARRVRQVTAEEQGLAIGSAGPTRSRCGRTSGSSPARATAT